MNSETPKKKGDGPESDAKEPQSKAGRRTLVDTAISFRRSHLLARLEGVALLADTARQFVDTTVKGQKALPKSGRRDSIRDLRESMRTAADEALEQIADIPSKAFDKFAEELRAESPEEKASV
jgi:hypothetical protein